MSTDEQFAAIGRIVSERNECQKQIALLLREIQDLGKWMFDGGGYLMGNSPGLPSGGIDQGAGILERIQSLGGIERLQSAISEYKQLTSRSKELSQSLRDAGLN